MYNFFMNSRFSPVLQIIPFVLSVGIVYVIARVIYLKTKPGRKCSLWSEAARLIFICYIAALLAIVWVPDNFWSEVWFYLLNGYQNGNISMFNGYFYFMPRMFLYFTGELTDRSGWFMLIANVVMLIPFGLLLPVIWKRHRWWKMLIAAVAVPVVIELVQPVFGRTFDTDDIITNALGICIGYLLFRVIAAIRKSLSK